MLKGILVKFSLLVFLFSAALYPANFSMADNIDVQKEANTINLYFFYGDGCPHCAKEEIFLNRLEREKDNIKIYRYEVWHNKKNSDLLEKIAGELGLKISGVPVLFIGDRQVSGYYNDKVTGKKILEIIKEFEISGCEDAVGPIIGIKNEVGECVHDCDQGDAECAHDCGCSADTVEIKTDMGEIITIPFFGEVNASNISLPAFTFLVAAADGFNPCAMWVLLFLISLLLKMKNRRRMWILGSTFIFASGLVYFLFLAAWLNLFIFLGFVFWIRVAIGIVALFSGAWHLRDAWRNRDGTCEVTDNEKRKKIFEKLRELATEKKFWIAISGIVLLAAAVNLVELVCSAGLPAVYTQVLALANLSPGAYYAYLVFYILIFMLDDLLVFVIAMTTLRMKAIQAKYTRWSGWVGGILMVIIGLLLLFKPGWLMLG